MLVVVGSVVVAVVRTMVVVGSSVIAVVRTPVVARSFVDVSGTFVHDSIVDNVVNIPSDFICCNVDVLMKDCCMTVGLVVGCWMVL